MIKIRINNEYKDIIKIFGGGTLKKEIIKVWSGEAQEYVYESSVEYTGSLPITITADGNALIDYRIYGASGGVGEPTENLFDKIQYVANYISGKAILDNGEEITAEYNGYSVYAIPVAAGETYTLKGTTSKTISNMNWLSRVYFLNGQKQFVMRSDSFFNSTSDSVYRFTVPNGIAYIELQMCTELTYDDVMLVEGSTAPTKYIPYGYKLPMTVSDGNTEQTVPVYIGSDPLGEDEYVSYNEGKIVRKNPANYFDGYFKLGAIDYITGAEMPSDQSIRTDFIELEPSNRYYIKWATGSLYILPISYDENKNYVRYLGAKTLNPSNIDLGANEKYIRFYLYNRKTPPKEMMVCKNANAPYYDPQDPPVPFPEIPTIDETTIIDYDGEPKPSQMYVKYRR